MELSEGFAVWDLTMATLVSPSVFVLGFSTLYLVSQFAGARLATIQKAYDKTHNCVDVAGELFVNQEQSQFVCTSNIRIQPVPRPSKPMSCGTAIGLANDSQPGWRSRRQHEAARFNLKNSVRPIRSIARGVVSAGCCS